MKIKEKTQVIYRRFQDSRKQPISLSVLRKTCYEKSSVEESIYFKSRN
jgi:hypothetical protein